jgi:hypothetical protein
MIRILLATMGVGVLLGGCADPVRSVVLRSDGQPISANPALMHAYNMDEAVCMGEVQKARLSGVTFSNGSMAAIADQMDRKDAAATVLRGCLAQKGYLIVREDEAERKGAELRSIAAAPSPIVTGSVGR